MRSIILCEGFDDVYILGYYLFKTQTWVYDKDGIISEYYRFPKVNFRNQIIEVYKKGMDSLAIWCVGGKDSYENALKFIKRTNTQHPEEGINKVFFLNDRDNSSIPDCLNTIEETMKKVGFEIGQLSNNQINSFMYAIEEEQYRFDIIPVIIPFDETGAIESILMTAIEKTSDEDKYVVQKAKQYIDEILQSGNLKKYLQHERLVLKAKFSATISVTNPDRSTALFNTLLLSCPWEEKEEIKRHFKIFEDTL